jgi:hypothetical protein
LWGGKGLFGTIQTLSTVYDAQQRYQNTKNQPGFKARLTFLELAGISLQRGGHQGGAGAKCKRKWRVGKRQARDRLVRGI